MNTIVKMLFGSALYGTSTPDSDIDLKAIYIPTAREIVLHSYRDTIIQGRNKENKERNTKDDTDVEIFSLNRYLELLAESQTVALDMIFAPENMYQSLSDGDHSSYIWRTILENKDKIINKNVNSFIGYARTQAAKYGVKGSRMEALKQTLDLLNTFHIHTKLGDYQEELERLVERNKNVISFEKEPLIAIVDLLAANKVDYVPHLQVCNRKLPFGADVKFAVSVLQKIYNEFGARSHKAHLNQGKDFKALSHAVRVNTQGLELLKTGHITFPRPDRELLLKIKKGEMPWDELSDLIESGLKCLVDAEKVSTLRSEPDRLWIRDFVAEVYTEVVKKDL